MNRIILLVVVFVSCSASIFASQSAMKMALENNEIVVAQQAYKALTSAEKSSIDGQVLYARLLLETEQAEASYDLLESLIDEYPNHIDLHYYFAMSSVVMAQQVSIFSKLSYAKDGLHAWEKVVKINPKHLDALSGLVGYHLAAPSIAGGDTEKALAYALQIKEIDAERGYFQLVNVYSKTDKDELAVNTLAKGLMDFPKSYQLHFLGGIKNINQKAWQQARTALNSALKYADSDSDKAQTLYQLGKVSAESGDELALGIEALKALLLLKDNTYENWSKYRLAQLYFQDKQISQAKKFIALINYDDDDSLKKRVKKLKKQLKKAS